MMWVILIIVAILLLFIMTDDTGYEKFGKITLPPPVPLGGKCALPSDCSGWGVGNRDTSCCAGTCKKKQPNWMGLGYCPEQCVGTLGGKAGTCT
jgi:hypothetical protein